jgi:hypothetical protein
MNAIKQLFLEQPQLYQQRSQSEGSKTLAA